MSNTHVELSMKAKPRIDFDPNTITIRKAFYPKSKKLEADGNYAKQYELFRIKQLNSQRNQLNSQRHQRLVLTSPIRMDAAKPLPRTIVQQVSEMKSKSLLSNFGTINRYSQCPCATLGYHRKRKIPVLTAHRYREGESTRLLIAHETLKSKAR
jgi:hypothetical protein